MFDRQIGNTAARIQPVGRGKGIGWTDIKAFRTTATMILLSRVMGKVRIGEDHPQKQP